jgi:hypothetical protein
MRPLLPVRVLCLLAASPASAFDLTGATLRLEHRESPEVGQNDQSHVEGSLAVGLGGKFGLQFGLHQSEYSPADFTARGYEVHLTYAVTEEVVLGAFYGRDDFDPAFEVFGLETDLRIDRFGLQTAVYKYQRGALDLTEFEIDASFDLSDRLSVLGGLSRQSGGIDIDYRYLGAALRVADTLALEARYGRFSDRFDNDREVMSVGLIYSFKGGAIFEQRHFTNLFPTE